MSAFPLADGAWLFSTVFCSVGFNAPSEFVNHLAQLSCLICVLGCCGSSSLYNNSEVFEKKIGVVRPAACVSEAAVSGVLVNREVLTKASYMIK